MSRTAWERKAPDAYWAQGDTSPAVSEQLLDGQGEAVDLGGASVRFQGLFPDSASSAQAIDQAAAIVGDATNGVVSYAPAAGDTDTIGDLMVQWRVSFAGGAIERFPNSGWQKVRIIRGSA
jgi:hypothetical protein